MAIDLLYGCAQIETTARNLDETRLFFFDVLGAGPIEQELASQIDNIIPDPEYGCDHIGLGDAVFQVNQPAAGMEYNGQKSVHQAYLDRVGPSVTNLNFFIDDAAHAKALLMELGAGVHIEGPSSAVRALADYGPGNTRAGADERPFLFMATRTLIGLDLEIMKPNFLRFADQRVQYPAFVQPRPDAGDGNLLLERLRIVVADLEATRANLERIYTPASVSRPYGHREGELGRAFRVWLGGIEVEYCQPLGSGPLADALEQFGPGVLAIDFAARDRDAALERAGGKAAIADEPDWLGVEGKYPRPCIASRAFTGFDAVISNPSPGSAAFPERRGEIRG
jgi:hypothetical protein